MSSSDGIKNNSLPVIRFYFDPKKEKCKNESVQYLVHVDKNRDTIFKEKTSLKNNLNILKKYLHIKTDKQKFNKIFNDYIMTQNKKYIKDDFIVEVKPATKEQSERSNRANFLTPKSSGYSDIFDVKDWDNIIDWPSTLYCHFPTKEPECYHEKNYFIQSMILLFLPECKIEKAL